MLSLPCMLSAAASAPVTFAASVTALRMIVSTSRDEFIEAAIDRVGGFYLIPPLGKYEIAVELVRFIKSYPCGPRKSVTT